MTMEFTPSASPVATEPRSVQPDTALARVLREAPYLARCSDNKTAALVRPREFAVRYPYMQINRRDMVSWLIFDLDHANSLAWDDAGLPAPNLVVRNRKSGNSHLFYAIVPVCTSEKARDKPIAYMKAIYTAFATRLNADADYHSGPVAKTPGHPWWSTTELHAHVYDLGELADAVDLEVTPWSKGPQLDDLPHSRHCILFEQMRYFAYSIVNRERERGSFDSFMRQLEAFAHNHNNFARNGFTENLMLSSLRATVRSVARWCWTRYAGKGGCRRGVMELDSTLPITERQSLAAERTHQVRRKATESKIRAACRGMQERGEQLTQAAIARAARVTRQTVAKYAHVLEEVARPPAIAVLAEARQVKSGGAARPAASVKHGAHQISARGKAALENENPSYTRGVGGGMPIDPPSSDLPDSGGGE